MKSQSTARSMVSGASLAGAFAWICLLVAGCSGGRPPVPGTARRIHVGQGAIQARAHREGVIWVVDDTDHRTLWSGPVHAGDTVALFTAPDSDGSLSVAGELKVRENLSPGHRYVVFENP